MCQKYGIVVIGPNAANVKQMGDKIEARKTFKKVLDMVEPVSYTHLDVYKRQVLLEKFSLGKFSMSDRLLSEKFI